MIIIKLKTIIKCFFVFILVSFPIVYHTKGSFIGNYSQNSQILDESSIFYIMAPENNSIIYEMPILSYYLNNISAQLEFYLNGSFISNTLNNTDLILSVRGYYNLTGIAQSNNDTVVESVFFSYFPVISIDFSYNTIYHNDFFHFPDYSSPIPCYTYDETVLLQASFNEKNNSLNLLIHYQVSSNLYELDSSNFTWTNDTCLNLIIEPLNFNVTTHKLVFDVTSSLPNGTNSIKFYFFRAVVPPLVEPDAYENFVNTIHSGTVQGHFQVFRGISDLTNISVFLDNQLIQYYYNKNGIEDFSGILTITINTTQYEDGEHELRIIVTDFFNLTTDNNYLLTFDNFMTPTNEPPTMPLYLRIILISLSVIVAVSVILQMLDKRYRFIDKLRRK